jgi:hypothetical protein
MGLPGAEVVTFEVPLDLADELRRKGLLTAEFVAWALRRGMQDGDALEQLVTDEITAHCIEQESIARRR